ncbi:4Fe-4S dicluster domain-containing protein [Clostridium sp. CX1]|uniref:4Fe-4S dicluster domain-containing protein n=1 Tax=Clostridium tanneri TaxID=3037988 RepID=A0ABU4JNZ6_9CLOT|nr:MULTISPECIES: 4Fe-4S dicluster domain-containing protein [unclassified Clostridium]MCT8978231.1 4Fe-4S dicluster domain-containing protein [Clostridium sp. CX1]MDW8799877.1 4Fe-4S dicluster domain-containing protein [Clostridium sp. A1-XYC3]
MKPDLNSFVMGDPNKCIGCRSCEVACAAAHREDNTGATIGTMDTPIIPRLFFIKNKNAAMEIQCRHCEDAPCANSCPAGAITEVDGSIVIDDKACIGCKTCSLVCPVGAIDLLPRYVGKVVNGGIDRKLTIMAYKCDMCKEAGGTPNCIKACPKDALKIATPKEDKTDRNVKAVLGLLNLNKNL